MEKVRGNRDYKKAFLVVLIVVLLSSCIFIGTIVAWLKDSEERSSSGNITLGTVDFEIYNGNTKLTTIKSNYNGSVRESAATPLEISGTTRLRSLDLKIRNVGTVSAIIRVTLQIYYVDSNGNFVTLFLHNDPTLDNQINIVQGEDWINDFKETVSGYSYYNQQVNPYTVKTINYDEDTGDAIITSEAVTANAVSVLSQILTPESKATQTYYVSIAVDGVAYSGNIYQELKDKADSGDNPNSYQIPVDAYPFGIPESLPNTWNAWQ